MSSFKFDWGPSIGALIMGVTAIISILVIIRVGFFLYEVMKFNTK